MFYTVYRIVNKKNRHEYVGVHRTQNLMDDYMGSGVRIKAAIKDYGVHNFLKEYIAVFDNVHDMLALEREIVNEDYVRSRSTYNCQLGGRGYAFNFV